MTAETAGADTTRERRVWAGEGGTRLHLAKWIVWPPVLFTVLFFVAPLVVMACVSFWTRKHGALIPEWTLVNYEKFFSKSYLRAALFNSFEVTLLTTMISVLLAYPLAYVLAFKVSVRWQRLVLLFAVLPFWTSYVVRSYSWLLVISDHGILNDALIGVGVLSDPVQIAYSRAATVLGFVHFFTMLLTLTIYSNLIQINPSHLKAAQDLGASNAKVLWHVTLPLSLPGIAVGAFLTFVITIGDYITPQILGGNTEVLMPQAIILQISRTANLPMASMMAILLMTCVLLVYFSIQRYLRMDRL